MNDRMHVPRVILGDNNSLIPSQNLQPTRASIRFANFNQISTNRPSMNVLYQAVPWPLVFEMSFSRDKISRERGRLFSLGQEVRMAAVHKTHSSYRTSLKIERTVKTWQNRYLGYRGRQIISDTFLNLQLQHLLYNMNFNGGRKKGLRVL